MAFFTRSPIYGIFHGGQTYRFLPLRGNRVESPQWSRLHHANVLSVRAGVRLSNRRIQCGDKRTRRRWRFDFHCSHSGPRPGCNWPDKPILEWRSRTRSRMSDGCVRFFCSAAKSSMHGSRGWSRCSGRCNRSWRPVLICRANPTCLFGWLFLSTAIYFSEVVTTRADRGGPIRWPLGLGAIARTLFSHAAKFCVLAASAFLLLIARRSRPARKAIEIGSYIAGFSGVAAGWLIYYFVHFHRLTNPLVFHELADSTVLFRMPWMEYRSYSWRLFLEPGFFGALTPKILRLLFPLDDRPVHAVVSTYLLRCLSACTFLENLAAFHVRSLCSVSAGLAAGCVRIFAVRKHGFSQRTLLLVVCTDRRAVRVGFRRQAQRSTGSTGDDALRHLRRATGVMDFGVHAFAEPPIRPSERTGRAGVGRNQHTYATTHNRTIGSSQTFRLKLLGMRNARRSIFRILCRIFEN